MMEQKAGIIHWFNTSLTVKLALIGFLFLVLLIPSSMIKSLVREREQLGDQVATEISGQWGKSQIVTGPVLSLPVQTFIKNDKETETVINYAHFLPEKLEADVELIPEIRYRGIYKMVVYKSVIHMKGWFKFPDIASLEIQPSTVQWKSASLSLGIPDMRGIQNSLFFRFGDSSYAANPGLKVRDVMKTGVSAQVPLNPTLAVSEIPFEIQLDLHGSNMLGFVPVGKESNITMESEWTNPSFEGLFLPDERTISEKGFTARWNILHLNREYPQQWMGDSFTLVEEEESVYTGNDSNISRHSFGVKLLVPVDHYQKSMRAVKYAAMFISLTFLVFFFIEILNRKKMHPVQYLLVGLALTVFFTLLLSISEQLGFNLAYLISSLSIVLMIGLFASSVFSKARTGWIAATFTALLYAFLFVLLQLQDYALLMGSIGLFLVLAGVMYLSRKVNWYNDQE